MPATAGMLNVAVAGLKKARPVVTLPEPLDHVPLRAVTLFKSLAAAGAAATAATAAMAARTAGWRMAAGAGGVGRRGGGGGRQDGPERWAGRGGRRRGGADRRAASCSMHAGSMQAACEPPVRSAREAWSHRTGVRRRRYADRMLLRSHTVLTQCLCCPQPLLARDRRPCARLSGSVPRHCA